MIRFFFCVVASCALALSFGGCEQAEYKAAVEQYQEQKAEAEQAAEKALRDGVVEEEERDTVREKVDQAESAHGDVAEEKADLAELKLK